MPLLGEGWKSLSFNIDSSSNTLPTGWLTIALGPNSPQNPDWNDVITDVDQLGYSRGDPEFFFIFQMWEIGMDNNGIQMVPEPLPAIGLGLGIALLIRRRR
ncbi:MAG: PEP-CTERM sorting domain-containing protein [Fimbriimonadales bacterium]